MPRSSWRAIAVAASLLLLLTSSALPASTPRPTSGALITDTSLRHTGAQRPSGAPRRPAQSLVATAHAMRIAGAGSGSRAATGDLCIREWAAYFEAVGEFVGGMLIPFILPVPVFPFVDVGPIAEHVERAEEVKRTLDDLTRCLLGS
ncbi:MAG: hypothetical protein WKG32_03205 [Gemmatimonadaceae bacterium]